MGNLRGATLMVLAMLGFAVEDMFIKMIADALPVGQILLLLGLGGAAVFGTACIYQGSRPFARSMLNAAVILRGLGEIFGTICFITAIALTPLSSASAILQATPLAVTLGAALFLGEAVGWRRWSAICVGFCGVLMIIRPGMEGFTPLSLFAVGGVIGLTIRDLATRRTPSSVTTMQLSFLGFVVLIPAGYILMLAAGTPFAVIDQQTGLYVVCALSIGVFAYYAIVAAMRVGEVSFVTPFRYSRMVFALIIGVAIFDESPDAPTLIGAAIIITSGLYTLFRERKQRVNHA